MAGKIEPAESRCCRGSQRKQGSAGGREVARGLQTHTEGKFSFRRKPAMFFDLPRASVSLLSKIAQRFAERIKVSSQNRNCKGRPYSLKVLGLGTLSPEDLWTASTESNSCGRKGWGKRISHVQFCQDPWQRESEKEMETKTDTLELYEIPTGLGDVRCASLTRTLETASSKTGLAFIY